MVPEVKKCSVMQCFYNRENECFAHAILVGSDQPICETFNESGQHTNKYGEGDIGACHISQCEYNQGMFCHACGDIEVGWTNSKAMCLTFEPKS